MQSLSSLFVSIMSLFWGRVTPKVNHLFVVSYLGLIGLCLKPFLEHNALKSRKATSFAIGSVLPIFCQSKVAKAIIRLVPVDMVNRFVRLLPGNVKPSQPVGCAVETIYLKVDVPLVVAGTRNLPNLHSGSRLCPPKNTSFRFVIEYLQEIFMVYVLHDQHDIVSYRDKKGLFYD